MRNSVVNLSYCICQCTRLTRMNVVYVSAKDRNDGGHVARPARIRQAEMAGGIRRGARRRMVVGQRHDDDDEDVDVDGTNVFVQ